MDESKVDKASGDWTINALREYFERALKDADTRYEQRFNDQKEAIVKAEEATERRFEGVNEFRQTLGDQAASFATRMEVNQQMLAVNEKVDLVTSRMDRLDGRSGGNNQTILWVIAGVGILGTLAGITGTVVAIVVVFTR